MDQTGSTFVKAIIAALGTVGTYLWGGLDTVLTTLVALVVIDYITGWAAAWVGGQLDSDLGRRGIAKKMGLFAVVAVCHLIDQSGALGEPILRTLAIWFYVANEALSITENLGEIGVPIPEQLRVALAALRDKEGGKDRVSSTDRELPR